MTNSIDTKELANLYYLATCRKAAISFLISVVLIVVLVFCLPDTFSWQIILAKALAVLAYFACILFLLINDTYYDITESLKSQK